MIDDDSNELIPFEGGDGDADASTGNNNPDGTQSVTIIQDEQDIVFLGDAGTINSLAQGRRLRFQSIQSQSRADHFIGQQRRTGGRQCHGRKRTLGKTHQGIG